MTGSNNTITCKIKLTVILLMRYAFGADAVVVDTVAVVIAVVCCLCNTLHTAVITAPKAPRN